MAGAEVVGRTRYCIHPGDLVDRIPIHGGTKTLTTQEELSTVVQSGDLVLLDREENPKAFCERFEALGARVIATHIRNLADFEHALDELVLVFRQSEEHQVAERLIEMQVRSRQVQKLLPRGAIPSLRSKGDRWNPHAPTALVIWTTEGARDATVSKEQGSATEWMLGSPQVYLGDVFQRLTGQQLWVPTIGPSAVGRDYPVTPHFPADLQVILLTEPFPFWRRFDAWADDLIRQGARSVHLVDGEAMSWFGIRSLRALEDLLMEAKA